MAFLNPAVGLLRVLRGLGGKEVLDPGNTSNVPADPPVQTGSWQFIQPQFFQGDGHMLSDTFSIGPAWTDWGQYAVNAADASGNTGGGVYSGEATILPLETDLYYDTSSGVYYNLG